MRGEVTSPGMTAVKEDSGLKAAQSARVEGPGLGGEKAGERTDNKVNPGVGG